MSHHCTQLKLYREVVHRFAIVRTVRSRNPLRKTWEFITTTGKTPAFKYVWMPSKNAVYKVVPLPGFDGSNKSDKLENTQFDQSSIYIIPEQIEIKVNTFFSE